MMLVSRLSRGSSAGGMNTGLNCTGGGTRDVDGRVEGSGCDGVAVLGGRVEDAEGSAEVVVDSGRQRRGNERPRARLRTLKIIL